MTKTEIVKIVYPHLGIIDEVEEIFEEENDDHEPQNFANFILQGELLMDIYNFMTNCQYEFNDIKTRIKAKLLRRDDNLNIMDVAPFIDAAEDNLLIVFYVDLGYVNKVNIGFYINNEHLRIWRISKNDVIKILLNLDSLPK